MATIERQYLPPLSPETKITEADRQRVYDIVRGHLTNLLEGDQSFYPDGVQKDLQARADDLDGFIGSIYNLQGHVDDPADIIGDVLSHLRTHAKNIRDQIGRGGPTDRIDEPPSSLPGTRDRNELYIAPNPMAPPTQILPRREWQAALQSPFGAPTDRPELRVSPPIFFRS